MHRTNKYVIARSEATWDRSDVGPKGFALPRNDTIIVAWLHEMVLLI